MKNNSLQIKALEKNDLIRLAAEERKDKFALSFYLGLKRNINFRSESNSILSGEAERIKKNKEYSKIDKKSMLTMVNMIKKEINFLRLPRDANALVFFLRGRGGVIIYKAPTRIESKIVIGPDYYIEPLVKIIEQFSRYLVAVIERDKAKFYAIFLNEIEKEPEELLSEVPKKIRTSASDDWHGRREGKIERHIEDHLKNHFKAVALKIGDYFKKDGFDHLIIGGHREMEAKFQDFLDKKSAEKLIGFFSLSHQDHSFVKEKSLKIINEHEKTTEEKIVKNLLGGLEGKKWAAVAGIGSVLENFYLRKIKMLVVGASCKKAGFVCARCRRISLFGGSCVLCRGKMIKAIDLVDEITEEAIRRGVKVKQLLYDHKNFDKFGIGTFLRDY